MGISDSDDQRPPSARRKRPKKKPGGSGRPPPLTPLEVKAFVGRVRFCHGEDRLTRWEAEFINSMKYLAYKQASWKLPVHREPIWLSVERQMKFQEILDKLHFDHPDLPLPAIDPDGIDDPDGISDPDGVIGYGDQDGRQMEGDSAEYFDEG